MLQIKQLIDFSYSFLFVIIFLHGCLIQHFSTFAQLLSADGNYKYLYPKLCIGINVLDNDDFILPYFMGFIEDLRYPKDQIHINLFANQNGSISKWIEDFPPGLYSSTTLSKKSSKWRESALSFGRRKSCSYTLLIKTDSIILRDSIRRMISLDKIILTPLLYSPFGGNSNAQELQLTEEFTSRTKIDFIRVYYSKGPLLINLKHSDSAYLTFSEDNLPNYSGKNGDEIDVFAFSAYSMNIPIVFSNHFHYGYHFDSNGLTRAERITLFCSFLANWVSDSGPSPYPISSALPPSYSIPTTFGFDQIYLINLERRPERLEKMEEILRLVGVEFKRIEAVDGHKLSQKQISSIKFMPGYFDPFHRRPIKLGEIGCFLSHLKCWVEIVQNGHQRAIVLEDDVRFTANATLIINKMVEDLMKTQLDWDFIYLGRKKMTATGDEFFVPGHRYLSTVAYSYWTIGYAISLEGAKKLIAARPLERMLALDEFLPIMYNKHPSTSWSAQFERRDLRAYALYPAAVEPEKYTNQPGYVSDTEASEIIGSDEEENGQKNVEEEIGRMFLNVSNVKDEF